jgi:hypothetical protein
MNPPIAPITAPAMYKMFFCISDLIAFIDQILFVQQQNYWHQT